MKNASAQDIWLVMEGPSDTAGDQWRQQRDLLAGRSGDDYVKSHVMCRMPVDSEDREMLSLREAISSIAIEEDFGMDENDVDFNFENVERKELYVHMACSMWRNVHNYEDWKRSCHQIVGFIIAVLTDLCEKNLLHKLFDQKDAQGRTILQIFVLCQYVREYSVILAFTFREMLEILPDACANTLDKAGRTVLHWAVGHDITWAIEELLESGKARPDVTLQTAYIRNITTFHLILLHDHNLPYSYRRFLKDELKRDFCEFEFVDADFSISDFRPEQIANVLYCGQYEWVGTNS